MAFPFQSCFFSNIMIILFLFLESNIMRTLGSYYVIGIMSFGDKLMIISIDIDIEIEEYKI